MLQKSIYCSNSRQMSIFFTQGSVFRRSQGEMWRQPWRQFRHDLSAQCLKTTEKWGWILENDLDKWFFKNINRWGGFIISLKITCKTYVQIKSLNRTQQIAITLKMMKKMDLGGHWEIKYLLWSPLMEADIFREEILVLGARNL